MCMPRQERVRGKAEGVDRGDEGRAGGAEGAESEGRIAGPGIGRQEKQEIEKEEIKRNIGMGAETPIPMFIICNNCLAISQIMRGNR